MSPKVSKEYKRDKKRNLIKAARKVFIQQGYVHTSMQDIMDEAGISRGAFYSYFDNIDHVFMEVLKFDDRQHIQFFTSPEEGPIWPKIKCWVEEQQLYIEAIHQTLLHAKAEFFLSSQFIKNKEDFPYISGRYNELVQAIEKVIQEGVLRGEFKPHLPLPVTLFHSSMA